MGRGSKKMYMFVKYMLVPRLSILRPVSNNLRRVELVLACITRRVYCSELSLR